MGKRESRFTRPSGKQQPQHEANRRAVRNDALQLKTDPSGIVDESPSPSVDTAPKPFVFVLMPFDPKFNDVYKFGIKATVKDLGAYAERLDEQTFNEGMLERIFNQINKADVIVADMTGSNANVYYEVGYAHALNKLVILLIQETKDITFDLKHHPHVVYKDADTLAENLRPKLFWALNQSRRRLSLTSDQFNVRVFGTPINPSDSRPLLPLPVVKAVTTHDATSVALPFTIQNLGRSSSSPISHVYLLTEPATKIPPFANTLSYYQPSYQIAHSLIPNPSTQSQPLYFETALEPILQPTGSEETMSQYRLDIAVPALPPGAVERFHLPLLFPKTIDSTEGRFAIRLHTESGAVDYNFFLILNRTEEPVAGNG